MDIIKLKVGNLQKDEIVAKFNEALDAIKVELEKIESRGKVMLADIKEYHLFASDEEDGELITNTENAIKAFITTCSRKQLMIVYKDIDSLVKMYEDLEDALNKNEIINELQMLVKKIDDKIDRQKQMVDDYWLTLEKKSSAFEDFDLSYKVSKRAKEHA